VTRIVFTNADLFGGENPRSLGSTVVVENARLALVLNHAGTWQRDEGLAGL
jgi:hypothetical protein